MVILLALIFFMCRATHDDRANKIGIAFLSVFYNFLYILQVISQIKSIPKNLKLENHPLIHFSPTPTLPKSYTITDVWDHGSS